MGADIAIVGGGPAGLSLAAMLEQVGLGYTVYERSGRNDPPQGGSLDLHPGSGQLAMKEAGCYEAFKKHSRTGDATLHRVYGPDGEQAFSWGEGRDAPEIERTHIKEALMTVVPEDKVKWNKTCTGSARDEKGQIVLSFDDGSTASNFKLVVGADGTWSKIRHLVTPTTPQFSNQSYLTMSYSPGNPYQQKLVDKMGESTMVVLGRGVNLFCQQQTDGHFAVFFGFKGPSEFVRSLAAKGDLEAAKKLLLSEDYFGTFDSFAKEMIKHAEGPMYAWPLFYIPPETFNWASAKGVTLIGDAAHTTTPFVGDGANTAMRDAVFLSRQLKAHGTAQQAIVEYEKQMFPFAVDLITRSLLAGELFFHPDSPAHFMKVMAEKPFIGVKDYE